MFEVRFWNTMNECIKVGGKYSHVFDTFGDAWDAANAFLKYAEEHGAVEMDINNDFYVIVQD